MTRAIEVARGIISAIKESMTDISPEEFDITPLKLQKLLYYCQGYSLALTGKPAFEDEIEAWRLGPVVESVYREYRKYNGQIIPMTEGKPCEEPDDVLRGIIRLVVSEKGMYGGIALSKGTHKERPYIESFKGAYVNAKIPKELLKEFFTEEILKREEDYDIEDEIWQQIGEPVSKTELENILEDL